MSSSHVLEREYGREKPASIALVESICAIENVDPTDLPTGSGFVLHDHVDPTALDSLVGDGTGDGTTVVSIEIVTEKTYAVDICDDGRIVIHHGESS